MQQAIPVLYHRYGSLARLCDIINILHCPIQVRSSEAGRSKDVRLLTANLERGAKFWYQPEQEIPSSGYVAGEYQDPIL